MSIGDIPHQVIPAPLSDHQREWLRRNIGEGEDQIPPEAEEEVRRAMERFNTAPEAREPIVGQKRPISQVIRERMQLDGHRFYAGDNVADYLDEDEKEQLISEATEKFEAVLDTLLIDRFNDPNSKGTGRRMAKMYINELFEGRFTPAPSITAFPNDDVEERFSGMLIATAELKSMCSHHHQTVTGKCWIGILPSTKVIGLSKYARLAQWLARRGTLQEELTKQIADGIMHHTGSKDIAVVVQAQHGCCTNRGIMANDSSTFTSVLSGQFFNPSVKQEFFNMIQGSLNRYSCT